VTGSRFKKAHYLGAGMDGKLNQAAFQLLFSCALGSRVIGANMQGKLFVALQLKISHQLVERLTGRRTGRVEDPGAFGATKALKTRLLNPYQLPAHVSLRPDVI
jgi:hypothetical protein